MSRLNWISSVEQQKLGWWEIGTTFWLRMDNICKAQIGCFFMLLNKMKLDRNVWPWPRIGQTPKGFSFYFIILSHQLRSTFAENYQIIHTTWSNQSQILICKDGNWKVEMLKKPEVLWGSPSLMQKSKGPYGHFVLTPSVPWNYHD